MTDRRITKTIDLKTDIHAMAMHEKSASLKHTCSHKTASPTSTSVSPTKLFINEYRIKVGNIYYTVPELMMPHEDSAIYVRRSSLNKY